MKKLLMEEDQPFKHGHLLTPPQGKLLKRTWQKKYYALHKASINGIERVEVFDGEDAFLQNSKSRKMIALNECIKVAQAPLKNQQNVFEVITKSQVHQFSAETTQELAEWVLAFQQVAFAGGTRRDPRPTTPPTLHSHGSLFTSEGLVLNAEEENQIYASYGGPQAYSVRVVETDASLASGLSSGPYLLVVSTIQLVLLEEGSNVNGKKYILAWPYRHIRRYGRGKNTFTFEAGRKCTTGEGTFTFTTTESNAIFQSMQANTRTLKREEEDAALLTPGIIMSRTANSWPSVDDVSESRADLSRLRISEAKDSKTILDKVLARGKVPAPFAKPPRKSKSAVSSDNKVAAAPAEPIRFELSSLARAKLAETSPSQQMPPTPFEPTYAEPEVRQEAWRQFALETDNIHEERMPETDEDYQAYATIPHSPTVKYSNVAEMWTPTKEMPPKILAPPKRAKADNSYDHLENFVVQAPASPAQSPDGHIYTRLTPFVTASSAEPGQEAPPGEAQENAPAVNEYDEPTAEDREDIKHFLQNDEVYTVVMKPVKKPSVKNSAT